MVILIHFLCFEIFFASCFIHTIDTCVQIVTAPRAAVQSPDEKFEVFYIDYGNQETVPYSAIRPIDPSVSAAPGLAQLCRLAYIKVPSLEDDFGPEAGEYLHTVTLGSGKEFKAVIEERDTSGGKVKGQGTGTEFVVTLIAVDDEISVNAAMLQVGFLSPCLKNISKNWYWY